MARGKIRDLLQKEAAGSAVEASAEAAKSDALDLSELSLAQLRALVEAAQARLNADSVDPKTPRSEP